MTRKIAVCDMETDPFKIGRFPEPFLIGLYDGDEYWQWENVCDLMDFLIDKNWIVYAHNGGKFDWHFILDYLNEGDRLKIINGRLSQFKVGLCEFRDSFNIIPVRLAAYKKDTIDYAIFEKDKRHIPANASAIAGYLKSDCEYLYDLVSAFIDEFGLHLTQATASLKVWQSLTKTKAPKSSAEYYNDFYRFYFGGRVQCFHKGPIEQGFESFDINSAYPYAMLSNHPFSLTYSEIENPDLTILNDNYDHMFFEIIAISKGCLPKRQTDNEIVFPIDEMPSIYFCTGHELRAGIETKTLQLCEITKAYRHHELINFDEYVYHFYNKKNEADREMKKHKEGTPEYDDYARKRLFYKLFLNSLYGKFAANPENYSNFWLGDVHEAIESFDYIDGPTYAGTLGTHTANILMCEGLSDEEQVYYNVATSASITGYVRAYLWRHICQADGVLYCDTDSIACNGGNFEFGRNLGQWESEGKFVGGGIAGKKLYAFEKKDGTHKTASKGVKLTADEILAVSRGCTVIYEPENPTYSIHNFPKFVDRMIKMN